MGKSLFRQTFSLRNGLRIGFGILVAALMAALAKAWWDSRAFEGYESGFPLNPEILANREFDGYATQNILINGISGDRIPVRIIRPNISAVEKAPCVIFLYGIGQNTRFFDRIAPIFAERGFAMAMPEQFHCGERQKRGIGYFREVLALRERSARIVPETRRLVDFLSQAPGIDPDRIYLIGASYGGITGCAVLAHEPRIHGAALVMAGGNLSRLFSSMARNRMPESHIFAPVGASFAAWFSSPFEPLNYIAKVSPRPLLFLNVGDDETIDPICAEELFAAAAEPKQKMTYAGRHNNISEEAFRKMLADALTWLQSKAAAKNTTVNH